MERDLRSLRIAARSCKARAKSVESASSKVGAFRVGVLIVEEVEEVGKTPRAVMVGLSTNSSVELLTEREANA